MTTMTRSKPHRRSAVRWAVLALELFAGIGAVYGAVMLVLDAWKLPLDYLDPLPLHSWVLPGSALFGLVAVPMLGAAALGTGGAPTARPMCRSAPAPCWPAGSPCSWRLSARGWCCRR